MAVFVMVVFLVPVSATPATHQEYHYSTTTPPCSVQLLPPPPTPQGCTLPCDLDQCGFSYAGATQVTVNVTDATALPVIFKVFSWDGSGDYYGVLCKSTCTVRTTTFDGSGTITVNLRPQDFSAADLEFCVTNGPCIIPTAGTVTMDFS